MIFFIQNVLNVDWNICVQTFLQTMVSSFKETPYEPYQKTIEEKNMYAPII